MGSINNNQAAGAIEVGELQEQERISASIQEQINNETEIIIEKSVKNKDVIALVNRYKSFKIKDIFKTFIEVDGLAMLDAKDAMSELGNDLKELIVAIKQLDQNLRSKTLGSRRYSDSLGKLEELKERCESTHFAVLEALGFPEPPEMPEVSKGNDKDTLLKTIHDSLASYNQAEEGDHERILADLYFAADYWLKVSGETSKSREYELYIDKSKKKEVTKLYAMVAKALTALSGIGEVNKLPVYLEENYGKGMEQHGYELDHQDEMADYFDDDRRDTYRVHVNGGLLSQYQWWDKKNPKKLIKADSSKSSAEGKDMLGGSGFVMSIGGDLYLAPHKTPGRGDKGEGVYHSSYFSGLSVLCGGEMTITNGKIVSFNPRSGHYRPTLDHMATVLKILKMQGIDIASITVNDYSLKNEWTGDAFIEEHSDGPSPEAFRANEQEQGKFRHKIFKRKLLDEGGTMVTELRRNIVGDIENGRHTKSRALRQERGQEIITYLEGKILSEKDFTRDERQAQLDSCKAVLTAFQQVIDMGRLSTKAEKLAAAKIVNDAK